MNNIRNFITKWRGYEKGEAQTFWLAFLRDVLDISNPERFIEFEMPVASGFIDAYLKDTRVIIEQKSSHVPLDDTVFAQAKKYNDALNFSRKARWIITCNFREFLIYDMDKSKPATAPVKILLDELPDKFRTFDFLVKPRRNLDIERQLHFDAAHGVRELYEIMQNYYVDKDSPATFDSLNKFCTRLVFCMYADSASVFSKQKIFLNYLESHNDTRRALLDIFKILNTPPDNRSPYDELKHFPYADGGLFNDENFDFPNFTPKARDLLFNNLFTLRWRDINPTIFGAVFESVLVLNDAPKKIRHEHGIHYTAPENIRKLINPLFMENFYDKLEAATSREDLFALQRELASVKILDPACGSGNFLTESYLLLRELENSILEVLAADGVKFSRLEDAIKVSIEQFYGIEINGFAVAVAKTALWISEIQMRQKTAEILQLPPQHFPLKKNPHIVEANALRYDWANLIAPSACSYIISNPPFVGTKGQTAEQKADIAAVCPAFKSLDYVTGWYKKIDDFISGTSIRAALVSTNSVTQGEQVAALWNNIRAHIDFAYRTFKWFSESTDMAQVHVVIIAFSRAPNPAPKKIFSVEVDKNENGKRVDKISAESVSNINGYLLDAPNVYVESRKAPICNVPQMFKGSQPTDNGNLIIETEDYEAFVKAEPLALKYIRPLLGSEEFIHGKKRWCLWLENCPPNELSKMKHVMKRVKAVREFRLKSSKAATRKDADTPTLFQEIRQPNSNYILVPSVSGESRRYVPIGFLTPDVIASNLALTIPGATLYHFGVLTSSVHMAWMRTVAGYLGTSYRYSATIVYNNFPWAAANAKQRAAIEATAAAILEVRAKYPEASLADLYSELTMPKELRAAHKENDAAVMAAYGFAKNMSEAEVVAALFKMYVELTR